MQDQPEGRSARSRSLDDVIDLTVLFTVYWRWAWVFVVAMSFGGAYGVWRLAHTTPLYEASMIVLPVSERLPGQLQSAGLNTLFGGSEQTTEFDRLRLLLGSPRLAKQLDEEYDFLHRIFAGSWNAKEKVWVRPDSVRFRLAQRLRELLGLALWKPPGPHELSDHLSSQIDIEKEGSTKFFRVSYRHADADFALEVLTTTYATADAILKRRDKHDIRKKLRYAKEELGQRSVNDMRQVLFVLLQNMEERLMMLEVDLPYAARIVEPAYVGPNPKQPGILETVAVPAGVLFLIALLVLTFVAVIRPR